MNLKKTLSGAVVCLALAAAVAQADEGAIRDGMAKLLPNVDIDEVVKSPLSGLYEVVIGPQVFYMSEDGRYLIQGDMIDIESRTNLTEARQMAAKKATMDKVTDDQTVVFAPEEYKHTVTVYTDIDCGYCRKMHREMEDYNAEGIRIRYLFYPRAGLGSPSYQKAVNVWCADDRKKAMTDAKSGQPLDNKTCDNPVQDHMLLGKAMGLTGTPAMVFENGQFVPGYIPAKRLAGILNGKE